MDIHRTRIIPYRPSSINALAFSHPTGSSLHGQPLRLAIGRENGDIEIWDPKNGNWLHEITLRGGRERSVQGLVWITEPDEVSDVSSAGGASGRKYRTYGRARLFSIGYSSTVTEWDLCTGLPRRQSTGSFGEVWCFAAQPRYRAPKTQNQDKSNIQLTSSGEYKGQNIVVGCADGTLVLLSTENDELNFQKYVARAGKKNARALSIRFQDRHTVVVGYSDSSIRVYDIRNGRLIRTMALGGGGKAQPKEKLVWAVECLKNGDVVSADSSGEVCFWDGKTYGMLQKIKGHDADALCLAASEDGMRVFSGGMDRRTCVYNCTVVGVPGQGQRRRWARTTYQRMHKHDVKAMASFDSKKKMSLVVSGGLDTQPIVIPLRQFGVEHHRALPFVPQDTPMAGAKRMLVSWWENQVTIWRVGRRRQEAMDSEYLDVQPSYHTVAQLTLKGEENIASASIAPSGNLLAVTTSAEIKVFHLEPRQNPASKQPMLGIQKLDLPASMTKLGARLVQFSQDSKWLLFIQHDNTIHLARIVAPSEEASTPSILPTTVELERPNRERLNRDGQPYQNCLNGSWGSYDSTITHAAFSSDSRILALSDLGGNIDTFVLEGNEDLAAPAVDVVSPSPSQADAMADSDDEDDKIYIIYGQHWAPNPSALSLPRLPSHAIVLSFRPSSPSSLHQPLLTGNPGVHPTRSNPHAHSNTLPAHTEDRLFVVTALHQLFEFHVLTGRLTPWSRRNQGDGRLPEEFRLQRDRAVGCFWDVQEGSGGARKAYERVWLYGASWLGMFDLSQDLQGAVVVSSSPVEQSTADETDGQAQDGVDGQDSEESKQISKKRKHSMTADDRPSILATNLASKKGTVSGAGSPITKTRELKSGVRAAKMRKFDKDGREVTVELSAMNAGVPADSEDEDQDVSDDDDLDDDDDADFTTTNSATSQALTKGAATPSAKPNTPFYMTLRYRPILGVVPLTPLDDWESRELVGEDVQYEASDAMLEVALVERPGWELELPERFAGREGEKER